VAPDGPMSIRRFLAEVGAMAMGATTYQWIVENDEWDYKVPCWVFTHRDFPTTDADIRFTQADVSDVHAEMTQAADGKNVWLVGGGDLVGQFADRGLLEELWIQYARSPLELARPCCRAGSSSRLPRSPRMGAASLSPHTAGVDPEQQRTDRQ
jgi:dihydrofolate reductase